MGISNVIKTFGALRILNVFFFSLKFRETIENLLIWFYVSYDSSFVLVHKTFLAYQV